MVLKRLLIFSFILFSSYTTFSQDIVWTQSKVNKILASGSENEIMTNCSMLTQEGYLFYAEQLADKLLEFKAESSNYNYRKGFLILGISRDYEKAIPFLEKAVVSTNPNYDMYSIKELSAPTDAYYHLARCYHFDEQLDKAEEFYNKFITNSKKNSERLPEAELRLKQVANARELMKQPVSCYLKNVGPEVNTAFPEYSPVISLDGSSLYFTSRRPWSNGETEDFRDPAINQYPEDVYVSYMDFDSSWMEPLKLEFCDPKRNEATIAVSTDERRIYLYEDSTGNGDIYYTDFYSAKFNEITLLEDDEVNTDYWETHCMVSHDRSRMFFTSDRKGGFGGRDIYVVNRNEDGTWGDPINLGPKINGPDDEDAPFVSIDNRQLYFGTNGDRSIGGFDIMVADLLEDGSWSEARNVGYPFNSTNDDLFYTTTIDGLRGFITSYREDGHGEKDIYEIKNDFLGVKQLAVLKGVIKTLDGSPLPEDFSINVKVTCEDCSEYEKNKTIFPRLRDGLFMTGLKPCQTYRLSYNNATDGLPMGEETFTTKCDTNYQEVYRELILDVPNKKILFPQDTVQEIPEVEVTEYPNLEFIHYFDYNKNKLTVKKGELKEFVQAVEAQLIEGRPAITINIYSSASHVPTKTYGTNENLTKIRAENMKYDLQTYFESKPELNGKVNIVIVSTLVQGPEYVKDASNTKKYRPYQYVGLKTE